MDFVNDASGRHLLNLSNKLTNIPDFVKDASVVAEDTENLPTHLFANPGKREFPMDTPGHVFLSYGYCKSAGIEDKTLIATLRLAGDKFGIKNDLDQIDAAFDGSVKQAAAAIKPRFAVYINFENGEKRAGVQGFYRIDTEEDVKASASKLVMDRHRIPLECFVDGCREIIKRAGELQIPHRLLPALVPDYGVNRLPDFGFLEQQADKRFRQTGDSIYTEIYKSASVNADNLNMDDYTALWKQADDLNGVNYTKEVWDPFRLFNSGVPEAVQEAELEKWAVINSVPVPVEALSDMDTNRVLRFFPKTAAELVVGLIKKAKEVSGSEISSLIEAQLDAVTRTRLLKLLAD